MPSIRIPSTISVVLLISAAAQALDTVKNVNGTSVSGKVVRISWDTVEIQQGGSTNKSTKEVPCNQILTILFDSGSPPVKKAINDAKKEIAEKHKYAEGLKSLAKINPQDIDVEALKQDYAFYTALANAKLALSGQGEIRDAGKAMVDFVKNNAESYHYIEACEVLGDLLVAIRSYPLAEEYYGKLAKTPWPETKMKASVLIGRAQLAQNKFDDALKSFQTVIDNRIEGRQADAERTAALLGKASTLIGMKKADEAVKILDSLIQKHDDQDAELMARTYNALGTAYRQLGNLKEAKFAFLRTDLLYSSVPEAHAEALANLAEIWEQLHNTERSIEAKKNLNKLYQNSPWAK